VLLFLKRQCDRTLGAISCVTCPVGTHQEFSYDRFGRYQLVPCEDIGEAGRCDQGQELLASHCAQAKLDGHTDADCDICKGGKCKRYEGPSYAHVDSMAIQELVRKKFPLNRTSNHCVMCPNGTQPDDQRSRCNMCAGERFKSGSVALSLCTTYSSTSHRNR
jgi:hypothetical protein